MRTFILLAAILLLASAPGYAQDEIPRFEVAGMFNLLRADIDVLGNQTMYGYGAGAQVNANEYFSLVAEWSAAHGSSGPTEIFQSGTTYEIPLVDTRVQTILAGPRLYRRKRALNMFAHFLVGAGTNKIDYNFGSYTKWQFAFALGGGVDVNVGKRFAIRLAQFDWLPVRSDLQLEGAGSFFNNWRYQAGGVIKF